MLYLGLSWRKCHPIVTEGDKEFWGVECGNSSCTELQLLMFFYLTSVHPKRRSQEKKSFKVIINQQNRKKGKAGGLRRARQLFFESQKGKRMVRLRTVLPPGELAINERRV